METATNALAGASQHLGTWCAPVGVHTQATAGPYAVDHAGRCFQLPLVRICRSLPHPRRSVAVDRWGIHCGLSTTAPRNKHTRGEATGTLRVRYHCACKHTPSMRSWYTVGGRRTASPRRDDVLRQLRHHRRLRHSRFVEGSPPSTPGSGPSRTTPDRFPRPHPRSLAARAWEWSHHLRRRRACHLHRCGAVQQRRRRLECR